MYVMYSNGREFLSLSVPFSGGLLSLAEAPLFLILMQSSNGTAHAAAMRDSKNTTFPPFIPKTPWLRSKPNA